VEESGGGGQGSAALWWWGLLDSNGGQARVQGFEDHVGFSMPLLYLPLLAPMSVGRAGHA
jgi:hypothetical protein